MQLAFGQEPCANPPETDDQTPLRADLFSDSQMEQHGKWLATQHQLAQSKQPDRLLKRLDDNEIIIFETCTLLTSTITAKRRIAPAGEWLLDNFYLIEEQIRTAKKHLPKGYSQELPRLAAGASCHLPRVYDIALEAISHGDGRVDVETLDRYIMAYQSVTPLMLGELWAIPIMLRLALIENLRRVGVRVMTARTHLNQAQDWAKRMMEVAENDPKSLILVIADMARSRPPMVSSFVAELARQLKGHGPSLALPLTWIEQRLAEANQTIEQMVLAENQQQASEQVSISNTIGSLRSLGAIDWGEFVEKVSFVEQVLREDVGGIYGAMDFATRDHYRHVVAGIAKYSLLSESEVARTAINLALPHASGDDPAAHVGFYLIGEGLAQLETLAAMRLPVAHSLQRKISQFPLTLYLGSILFMTLVFTSVIAMLASAEGVAGWRLMLLSCLLLLPSSQLASALTGWLATLIIAPERLPRMDFSEGLPANRRTLLVIPTMLDCVDTVTELLDALEVRFLGNRDEYLHFALLTDFLDAKEEVQDGDAALVKQARAGIERLNEQYRGTGVDRFFLFHRPRRWESADQLWMGYERKRGKLAALNRLLRGEGEECFSLIFGDLHILRQVKYVITLDTDTQLSRESARQFVAAMAHPLNQPRFDEQHQRVTAGYGIMQPRMASSLAGASRSPYAQLFGGESGIDPYTRSVSNVYQDVFGEGSFIGKGIYDVDAFEQALKGRFPDNQILSHDLLEGCYARSGLLSDLHLYEEHPTRYMTDVGRQSRWIRGDWQILHWLLPRVPSPTGSSVVNPLSTLSRWKILDNLRRSLVSAAMMLLLLTGWCLLPQAGWWTLALVGVFLLPPTFMTIYELLRKPHDIVLAQHLTTVMTTAGRHLAQAGFRLACLPHEALFSLEAILRSLWRMIVTHQGLLEWRISTHSSPSKTTLLTTYRMMWITPFAALITLVIGKFGMSHFWVMLPFLCLWLAAPALVWWMSQPIARREVVLSSEQVLFLRRMSRKTWDFFEKFVVAEDNWLPPDNFQESPCSVIAHRTSPTNLGLALLANLSAYDFGYIPLTSLLTRTENAFLTMSRLERHQGHFYNWYDTQTLQPLPPRYISAVDSGNLAGHLLTLRMGLLAVADQPIISDRLFVGLSDTFNVLRDFLPDTPPAVFTHLETLLVECCARPPMSLVKTGLALDDLCGYGLALVVDLPVDMAVEGKEWANNLLRQCQVAQEELVFLVPWLDIAVASPELAACAELDHIPTLNGLSTLAVRWLPILDVCSQEKLNKVQQDWLSTQRQRLVLASERAKIRLLTVEKLARQAADFALMEYGLLYVKTRHLLAIGYNVDESRRDTSYYDLLASEARLSTFVAIAQGQLPQDSWFALGRLLTTAGGEPILMSWSGSMFEYLMPMLVTPSYQGSLLEQTCRAAVARQIAHGNQRGLPWGVSESGYNAVDASLNYRYHAFGTPDLGLKRGLSEDSVVAPYASALALMVEPEAACENLQRLAALGLDGRYGFYEAIDYTPSRLARGQTGVVVQSFMAHHQGMSLIAIGHLLLNRPMQRRFESDPLIQASLLLLQERIPKTAIIHQDISEPLAGQDFLDATSPSVQAMIVADTPIPEVQLLSNGRYHVMLTNAGGGYSRWRDLAVTRWREDSTCDNWGTFLYLRDVISGDFWSAAHQPTLKRASSYAAMFSEGRAEFRRRDNDIETYSEIVVSPEDDIELRRLKVTNRSSIRRTIEVTSYAEVVLALPAADNVQPSFGNLFVQTEIMAASRAILCTRRPRSLGEHTPWMFHLMAANGTQLGEVSYETDRMRFIGRGRTLALPQVLASNNSLSGTQGSVLDPIVAIRCLITLEPEQSATIDWVFGATESKESCLALVDKYQDRHLANRVFELAGTHSGVTLRQINASEADAQMYRSLASSVLYANASLRADASLLRQNRRGQSGLWGYAISGDLPIVLLKIADTSHIDLAHQLIQCHAYWRLKGLTVDLVIWNEDHAGYRQQLQEQILALITTGSEIHHIDRAGGIFVRSAEQISHEDRILLQSVARAIITDTGGTLEEQLRRQDFPIKKVPRLTIARSHRIDPPADSAQPEPNLILANNLGGFSADGREYIITSTQTQRTPLPWVNVLANADFGTVITESGQAYTWSENAHEFRLTPWSDDAVSASGGEAMYLRDEENGHFWSPTPLPCSGAMPYRTRHGFGYSVFEHTAGGIHSELWVYVDIKESVKFSVLKIRNGSGRTRRLSATNYIEWVLGDLRPKSAMHIVTEYESDSGALLASNAYNNEFEGRVAFLAVGDVPHTVTADRTEFLGRNGCIANPDALSRAQLSGRVGAGLDPCAAIQVPFELADGQEREIVFCLGAGRDMDTARDLLHRLNEPKSAEIALQKVQQFWRNTLDVLHIETPNPELNVLTNGWLVYQTLACRLWARSGFYQSGGAFGFRDQLQDAMALVNLEPQLLRAQLLLCASRQYPEGDVQHWWHPPMGRGVRTRCSDDYLWLPLAACRYVSCTGDVAILSEETHFLEGRLLDAEEESYYDLPHCSRERASLYQHCVRALRHGLRFGEHGLPLMGSGDWNDGMNLVGIEGKGESVWLGFFLYDVLNAFADIATGQHDVAFAKECQEQAAQLKRHLAEHAWDGAWYRRAWFDDGTPLGSSVNPECSIDSIAQSWSVLSGGGDVERSRQAMDSLDTRLVRREAGLVQLLDPPFDKSAMNPGYIKGYVAGVRENGGQYTHAAIWAAMAFAKLGDNARAWELLGLINPLYHSRDSQSVAIYKAEPYVVAADVYAVAPHTGRGGWTWYTGSAGWLYRLITESLLGLNRQADQLTITPCLPKDWPSCAINYRYGQTLYRIVVKQLAVNDRKRLPILLLDGVQQSGDVVTLIDDQKEHYIDLRLYLASDGQREDSI
ncbi:cyclic beta 1-2 glucan synthetase [Moraxellaceae bacterium AER2_44_116]|nr:cyclic beta 1-2 glucan synthetase [Moraxellaceae bacterium AER2_44_116]